MRLAGGFGACVGVAVLVGWLLHVPSLKSVLPGLALMQPNTALSLMMAGLTLLAAGRESAGPVARRVGSALAAVVAAIGAATLVEYSAGVDLRIDRLLFGDAPGSETVRWPGRMSLMTAVCVSCLGVSLILRDARGRPGRWASQGAAAATALFAMLDLIGYAYGVRFLYLVGAYSSMALHTAMTLFVLGLGAAAMRPDAGLMKRFLADDAGGWLLRNMLPVAVAVPIFLGGVRVFGEESGWFNPRFGSAVLVLSNLVSLLGLLLWTADRLSDLDAERLRADLVVRENRELLRTTLTSIGDAVIATDPDGRVTFLNPVAEALTGWSPDQAAGRPLGEVFRIVDEATGEPVENPALRALREGTIVGLANHTILVSRDGRRVPIDDSAAPIRHDPGPLAGSVLVFRDISERRRQGERLRDALSRLESILTESQVATWEYDVAADLVRGDANFARMFGVTPEVAAGAPVQTFVDAIHPDDRAEVQDAFEKALEAGGRFEAEYRLAVPGQPVLWVVARGRVERDVSGRLAALPGVVVDITARKQGEERQRQLTADLSEADRRKDEFLATLAHELRNPLAPIRNALQIMRLADPRPDGHDPDPDDPRAMMERQVTHMVRLIDDLMDVSRITRNKLELRPERVDLADVVRNAVETSRPLVEAARHDLAVNLPARPIAVDADVTRLSQVFSNLLNNAAKYTEPGGQLALSVRPDGGEVVVSIRDNGVGIPAAMLPRVFEMFTQVDRTLERAQGGLGIGLSLVRRLVEMHRGSVEARSAGHGQGSEFLVRLPIAPPLPPSSVVTRSDAPPPAPASARRILVVDDNQDSARTLSRLLKLLGHEVRTAHDGGEAVAVAESYRPELMLLDIGLPVMNGYDVARSIRSRAWGEPVMIVALTGWGQDGDRLRSLEAGIDRHLIKPVDPAALEELLAGLD